jgi:hypothetical protein
MRWLALLILVGCGSAGAGRQRNAGPVHDAGMGDDAGPLLDSDAGPDAGQDIQDAGLIDAGEPNVDAGPVDAGEPDHDAGPWCDQDGGPPVCCQAVDFDCFGACVTACGNACVPSQPDGGAEGIAIPACDGDGGAYFDTGGNLPWCDALTPTCEQADCQAKCYSQYQG